MNPKLVGDVGCVQAAGAAEGEQRVATRVDAAVHRDHGQRPGHLGACDAADPLGAFARREPQRLGQLPDDPLSGGGIDRDVAGQRRCRLRCPSTTLASVTVGSVPPRA